jgi:hypothetical protein
MSTATETTDQTTEINRLYLNTNFSLDQEVFVRTPADKDIDYWFDTSVSLKLRVANFKNFLKEPTKVDLVKKLPTQTEDVSLFKSDEMIVIKLRYVLLVLANAAPELKLRINGLIENHLQNDSLGENEYRNFQIEFENMLSISHVYSLYTSAALKVFSLIEGLGFDSFSSHLSAIE